MYISSQRTDVVIHVLPCVHPLSPCQPLPMSHLLPNTMSTSPGVTPGPPSQCCRVHMLGALFPSPVAHRRVDCALSHS